MSESVEIGRIDREGTWESGASGVRTHAASLFCSLFAALALTLLILDFTTWSRYGVEAPFVWRMLPVDLIVIAFALAAMTALRHSLDRFYFWYAAMVAFLFCSLLMFTGLCVFGVRDHASGFGGVVSGVPEPVFWGFVLRVFMLAAASVCIPFCVRSETAERREADAVPAGSPATVDAPTVRARPPQPPPPSNESPSQRRLRRRLAQLDEARTADLITQQEFDTRRADLLSRHGRSPDDDPNPSKAE